MRMIHTYMGELPEDDLRLAPTPDDGTVTPDEMFLEIDEAHLAWVYIAPGQPLSATSRSALALARALIGEGAWAVVQAPDDDLPTVLGHVGMRVIESYENRADNPAGISVHIAQAVSRTPQPPHA